MTLEEFINQATEVHQNKYNYSKSIYVNANFKIIIGCPIHGDFKQSSHHHLRGIGCPTCRSSKGELVIKKLLDEKKIIYELQKVFENCKGKRRKLPFDFYLPEYNTCIEFQGKQHYKEWKYWGGQKKLEEVQATDKIKKEFCLSSGIKLLEITYEQDPIQILNTYIFSGQEVYQKELQV